MWIAFSGGFLSVVARPPHTVRSGDARTLQVRARDAEHLRRFRRDYCVGLGRVLHSPQRDYQYRAYVAPAALAEAMIRLVGDVDYTNFKDSIDDRYGDYRLHGALLGVWGTLDRVYSRQAPGRFPASRNQPRLFSDVDPDDEWFAEMADEAALEWSRIDVARSG